MYMYSRNLQHLSPTFQFATIMEVIVRLYNAVNPGSLQALGIGKLIWPGPFCQSSKQGNNLGGLLQALSALAVTIHYRASCC